MADLYTRWQAPSIERALKSRRVILLAGARQCGKTTLANMLKASDTIYRTLDDLTLLDAALSDPHGFVDHKNCMMIIDEVQRAPVLLQAIKYDVDKNQEPGRFLITGSANIQSLPGVKESLAGRISKFRLRPLAMGEVLGVEPSFIQRAFQEHFTTPNNLTISDKEKYILDAFKGGYPEAIALDIKEARLWQKDYIDALIERDLKDILNIKRQDSLRDLLHVVCAWSSKFIDFTAIGSGLSLTRQTISSYINALQALYLIDRVPAWTKTEYDRVNKKDKLFMSDTGLLCAYLNWTPEKVNLNGENNGKLLETFVFTQLAAMIDVDQGDYSLSHYRDREKREIDFIIENIDGDLLGVEVKAASLVNKKSFQHLEWFSQNLAKQRNFIGIVLYTGKEVLRFGDKMWAVPIAAMWSN